MSESKNKISFYGKNPVICPVCDHEFKKEELLSGGGRMNAGDLTDELHRQYIPTNKYGSVHPLIYPITVCPECLYSAYALDFDQIEYDTKDNLALEKETRIAEAKNLFPAFDFHNDRTIKEGILSYVLAIMCYDKMESDRLPIYRQGLSALRAAWLCNDSHLLTPDENFDYLRDALYRKAQFFYSEVIVAEKEEREFYEDIPHYGPDIDHNNGFDGVLFLAGLLEYKYGPKNNKLIRGKALKAAKVTVARIVGMGKSSKAKTSDFVENARELHRNIQEEIKTLEEDL